MKGLFDRGDERAEGRREVGGFDLVGVGRKGLLYGKKDLFRLGEKSERKPKREEEGEEKKATEEEIRRYRRKSRKKRGDGNRRIGLKEEVSEISRIDGGREEGGNKAVGLITDLGCLGREAGESLEDRGEAGAFCAEPLFGLVGEMIGRGHEQEAFGGVEKDRGFLLDLADTEIHEERRSEGLDDQDPADPLLLGIEDRSPADDGGL